MLHPAQKKGLGVGFRATAQVTVGVTIRVGIRVTIRVAMGGVLTL